MAQICKYVFDKRIHLNPIPTFNDGFQYTVSDTTVGNFVTRTITSDADFSRCSFNNNTMSALTRVDYLKVTSNVTNMNGMFAGCSNLTSVNTSDWDTSNITNMGGLFNSCQSLTSLDLSNFNTEKVTEIAYMFNGCYLLTELDLSNFNTEKVLNMQSMFGYCSNLTSLDIGNFNTSNVTNMNGMFQNCSNLTSLDLSNFNTTNVTNMNGMFRSCASLTSLDLSNFDTSNVADMQNIFNGCISLESINLSNWDTSNAVHMHTMFYNCKALTSLDVSHFNTSKATNLGDMFYGCKALTSLDLSNWNTEQVTNMGRMFTSCASLTSLDVSKFDTSKVIDMNAMFSGCSNLTSLNVSNFNTKNVTSMYAMFGNCASLTSLDLSNFDTSQVTNIGDMFYGCTKLTSLDLSNFNTSNMTNMEYTFRACHDLTSLDLSSFNTEKVTSMKGTFSGCSKITSLDLSNFNTSKVKTFFNMFYQCKALTSLDLSNFNASSESDLSGMFYDCKALTIIALIYADIDSINKLPSSTNTTLYIDASIDESAYTGSSILHSYYDSKREITLPCPLRSKGDVADRLYWDNATKNYYIEQWIDPDTEQVLSTPNIITAGIIQPIYLSSYDNRVYVDIVNQEPSYVKATVPHFTIPDDYVYDPKDELEYIKQSFELRFPDADDVAEDWGFMSVGEEGTGLKALIDWVDNCSDAEFVAEFEKHFHKDYTLRYYLLVITLGMVDNLGKNMMLDTWDNKIFMPRFYDCDTICSYDNSGDIKFDVDIEMEQGYWNTSTSRLWTRVRDLFHDELVAKYADMRGHGLSYENLMACFYDEQIARIPQRYYNNDADVKYLPFAEQYLGMAHGDGLQHLKHWLKRRIQFVDSLFDYAPSYNNDVITIRANTTQEMEITIETYNPVYLHMSWYNGQMDKKKIDGKEAVTFSGYAMAATDQEVLIYGASNIKRISGLTSMNPDQIISGAATKLIELEVNDCPILANFNLNGANLASHIYLNKLKITNCPMLGGALRLNNAEVIREIDMRGTSISDIQLASNVRSLESIKLPNTITSLTLNDASKLHTLYLEEGSRIQSIRMTNCNNLVNVENFNLLDCAQVYIDNAYNTVKEFYFNKAVELSLRNLPELERVIYTPNAEHEVFDKSNMDNAPDYAVSTFNCPKLSTFMTTAPYRDSYGKEYGEVKPDEVFEANSIDISNTQVTDVKLLCTTDTNVLKLPQTVKSLIVDSAYDLDTAYLTDGDYDTIHTDLYEPYNTGWNENIVLISEEKITTILSGGSGTDRYCNIDIPTNTVNILIGKNTDAIMTCTVYDINNNQLITQSLSGSDKINLNLRDYPNAKTIRLTGVSNYSVVLTFTIEKTPNIIPSASDGSIIQSMYAPSKTEQPEVGVWDLEGLELDQYHTFGLNNDVKPSEDSYVDYYTDKVNLMKVRFWASNSGATLSPSDSAGMLIFDKESLFPYATSSNTQFTASTSNGGRLKVGWLNSGLANGNNYIVGTNIMAVPSVSPYLVLEVDIDDMPEWVQLDSTRISFKDIEYFNYDSEIMNITMKDLVFTEFSNYETILGNVNSLTMPNRYDEYSVSVQNRKLVKEVARYTASDANTFPAFNNEFTYTYSISGLDGAYEYSILADSMDNLPTSISFNGKSNLLTVEYLNTSNVTSMNQMFYQCTSLTSLNVSNFDTSNVTNMIHMFSFCSSLTQLDLSNWNTSKLGSIAYMFAGCTNLTSITFGSNFDTSNVTNMSNMFSNCYKLTSLDVDNFDTSNVSTMSNMFQGCDTLTTLDVSNFNTSEVTKMDSMFKDCTKLTSLDVSNFNTENVTNMSSMFQNCSSLTSLDVSNFNTEKVTNMSSMFNSAGFTSLNLSNFDVSKVTSMSSMFSSKLTSLDSMMNISTDLTLSSTKLNAASLLDVIDNLATVSSTKTLKLGTTLLAKLTEAQIAVATNKGWTVE